MFERTQIPPDAAELEERVDEVVVAGVQLEIGLLDDPPRLVEIRVRLLDRAHGRDLLGQLHDRRRGHVHHHAPGDVVGDDRLLADPRDRAEVLHDSALGRLVVVGRDDEEPVDSGPVGLLGEMHRVGGGVRAGAGDHGRPPADLVDGRLPQLDLLLVRERRRLAGGGADDDPVGAVVDQLGAELAEPLDVDSPVRVERRDDGGQDLSEQVLLP